MKFSSKVLKCGLSPMRKFHPYAVAAEAKGRKIYHLNIGQPDIETPKAYFDAVKHFDLPVLAYAPSPGIPELIEAIRKYYADLGMHFDAGDILITNGGSEALQITMNCILDDGDEILIPEPFYPNYNTMAYTCGAKIHPIPTSPHDGYHYADRAKVEAEINEHTRAIMVTNPGNPTGAVLTPEEMRMLVDVAKAHDLFIIGDEAYREFVYAGEPLQSMGQFEDAAENVIVIDTVSKRFSACGARIGCMISRNKELMAQAMKYAQCRLSVPTLDQVAAAALYTVGPDYFAAVREEYKRRRDTVAAGGVRGQRRHRDVRPRRALLRYPRQGQERDPHRLCAEAGGPGARHGPAGQGYRRLQRPVNGYMQKKKALLGFLFLRSLPLQRHIAACGQVKGSEIGLLQRDPAIPEHPELLRAAAGFNAAELLGSVHGEEYPQVVAVPQGRMAGVGALHDGQARRRDCHRLVQRLPRTAEGAVDDSLTALCRLQYLR